MNESVEAGLGRLGQALDRLAAATGQRLAATTALTEDNAKLSAERDQLAASLEDLREAHGRLADEHRQLQAAYDDLARRKREARERLEATMIRLRGVLDTVPEESDGAESESTMKEGA